MQSSMAQGLPLLSAAKHNHSINKDKFDDFCEINLTTGRIVVFLAQIIDILHHIKGFPIHQAGIISHDLFPMCMLLYLRECFVH